MSIGAPRRVLDIASGLLRFSVIPHVVKQQQCSSYSSYAMPLSDIPDVDIDPSGTFKYILIKCTDNSSSEEKHIVRGYYKCNFHADILKVARDKAGPAFKLKCVGGGRIKHENDAKKILVYGYSQGYGQADHAITVDILKKRYTDYNITYSNEGY